MFSATYHLDCDQNEIAESNYRLHKDAPYEVTVQKNDLECIKRKNFKNILSQISTSWGSMYRIKKKANSYIKEDKMQELDSLVAY